MQKKLVCFFLPALMCFGSSGQEEQAKFSDSEIGIRASLIPADYKDDDYIEIDPDYYYTIEPELTRGHFLQFKESFPGSYYRTFNYFNGGVWVVKNMKKTHRWYYRVGIDYFYYRQVYEDDRESYPASSVILLGYDRKISSLKASPGIGYRKEWKFLTFKAGLEVPLGITAKGKHNTQLLYQDTAFATSPYPIYPGHSEYYQTNPRRFFTGLNLYTQIEFNFLKRLAAGFEMGNGFTYNIAKGTGSYILENYDNSDVLYRSSERSYVVKHEGSWWEPLRFSLTLSYRF